VAHVAAEIVVGKQVLGRWVGLARERANGGDTGAVLDADERAELERLRKENAELRLDREFLKKPRPSSLPSRTGRSLPGHRGGEGHLPDHTDVWAAGGVAFGYYKWRASRAAKPTPAAQRRAELDAAVTAAHEASDGVYGAPRILAELRAELRGGGCHARRWLPHCAASACRGSARADSGR
jgi:hypothetical protein